MSMPYSIRSRPGMGYGYGSPYMRAPIMPHNGPTSGDPEEIAKFQAGRANQIQQQNAFRTNQMNNFKTEQDKETADYQAKEAPFNAALAARHAAQEAAGADKSASPELAAAQLADQSTGNIQDPADQQAAKDKLGLTPFSVAPTAQATPGAAAPSTASTGQQLNQAVTDALKNAQAGKAGSQSAATQGAYSTGYTGAGGGANPNAPFVKSPNTNLQPNVPTTTNPGITMNVAGQQTAVGGGSPVANTPPPAAYPKGGSRLTISPKTYQTAPSKVSSKYRPLP